MTSQHDQEKIAQLERALANRRGLVVMAGICDRTTPHTIILQLYRKEPDGSVSVLAMLGQAPEPILRLDEVVDSLTYVQTPKKENHDSQPVPTIPIQPGAPSTPRADGAGAQGTANAGKQPTYEEQRLNALRTAKKSLEFLYGATCLAPTESAMSKAIDEIDAHLRHYE